MANRLYAGAHLPRLLLFVVLLALNFLTALLSNGIQDGIRVE